MDTALYAGCHKGQSLIPGQARICSVPLQPLRFFILQWSSSWLSYFTNATFPKAFQTAQNVLQLGDKKRGFFQGLAIAWVLELKNLFFATLRKENDS